MDPAPVPVVSDPFNARATLSTPFGETVTYYNLRVLQEQGFADLDRLPFTVRVFLENVLRHAGGEFVDEALVKQLAAWQPRKAGESSDTDEHGPQNCPRSGGNISRTPVGGLPYR